jgi:hypothetical protein
MAAHAAIQYAIDYPDKAQSWENNCNSIVLLAVEDEDELLRYYLKAADLTGVSLFKEPDIGNESTSFACVLSPEHQSIFSNLPLLLKSSSLPRGGGE